MNVLRVSEIVFDLPDGREVRLRPPTVSQVLEVTALDVDAASNEAGGNSDDRIADQVAVFLRDAVEAPEEFMKTLAPEERAQILLGVVSYLEQSGTAKRSAKGRIENAWSKCRTVAERVDSIESMIWDLSIYFHCPPRKAMEWQWRDAVAVLSRLYERERRETVFQAAIHGAKLK